RAADLLGVTPDAHRRLVVKGMDYLVTSMPEPNVSVPSLRTRVPEWREVEDDRMATGRFAEGPSYVWIGEWDRLSQRALTEVYAVVRATTPDSGLILDVRANPGGDELLAAAVAGCFVTEPVVYSTV